MDVKFNVIAAEKLIWQLDKYCSGIQKETKELLMIMRTPSGWNDGQMQTFQITINEIAKDLNQVLMLESEYMRTYYQRVKELME